MTDETDICSGCPLCRPEREQDDARGDCAGCSVCSEVELEADVGVALIGEGKLAIEVAVKGQGEVDAG